VKMSPLVKVILSLLSSEIYANHDVLYYSPMKCQEKCHNDYRCGSWAVMDHNCSLSNAKAASPLYFREESGKIFGGRRTTESVKRDALVFFQMSFELLNNTIPSDNDCKFLHLKENLEHLTELSNNSVHEIQLVDSFLSLNDEFLGDIFLLQSDMVNEVEVSIEAKKQKKRLLEREVDAWNSKLAIVNDQITSLREKEKHVLQEMENVKKRERAERASVIAAETTLKEKQTNLKRKEYQRSNALDKLNSATAEKDRQFSMKRITKIQNLPTTIGLCNTTEQMHNTHMPTMNTRRH